MTTSFDNEAYAVGPGPWFCDGLTKSNKKKTTTTLSLLRSVPGLAGISCCADTTDAAKTGDDLSSQSTISETSQDAALVTPPVVSTEKRDATAKTSWTKPWVCFAFEGMDKVMFDLDALCGTKSQSTANENPPPTIDILAEERCVTPMEADKPESDAAVVFLEMEPHSEMEPHAEEGELADAAAVDSGADAEKDQVKATMTTEIEGVLEVPEKPRTVTVTLDPPTKDDSEEIRRYLMQAKSTEEGSFLEPQEDKQEDGDESDMQGQSKLEFDEVHSSTTQTQVSCVVIFHNMATGSFCDCTESDPIDAIAADPEQDDDDEEEVREEDEQEPVQNEQEDKEQPREDEGLVNGDESIPDTEVKSEEPQPTCCPMATAMEVEEETECESKDTAELNIVKSAGSEDDEETPSCTTDDKDATQSESSVSINVNEKEEMPTIYEKDSTQSDSSVSTDRHKNDSEPVLRLVSLAVGRELDEDECYDSCEEGSTEGAIEAKEQEPEHEAPEEPIEPKDSPEEQEAEHETSEGPIVRMVSIVTGVFDSIDSVVPFN